MSSTVELAQRLIQRASVTPEDAGCQDILSQTLEPSGFISEHLAFGEVQNIWIRRGSTRPLLVFVGHTDVVPTGPADQWKHPPFEGKVVDGVLHGRGAADMKGSLAAMATACRRFVENHSDHQGSIALLLTSDEEGPAVDGTVRVIETLMERGIKIDWCLVGEPTSRDTVGDIIKNGRRGSLGGTLTVTGIQGHVAYPHLADNPIHRIAAVVDELAKQVWDQGNTYFPPTTFQVSNLNSGTGASNVIPGHASLDFNFRYSPESTVESLKASVEATCRRHTERFEINWSKPNLPFLTNPGDLLEAVTHAIKHVTRQQPRLSTDGGTSDGRFVAPTGAQVVELGPVNRTIHQIDEEVLAADLDLLSSIYQRVLENLLLRS